MGRERERKFRGRIFFLPSFSPFPFSYLVSVPERAVPAHAGAVPVSAVVVEVPAPAAPSGPVAGDGDRVDDDVGDQQTVFFYLMEKRLKKVDVFLGGFGVFRNQKMNGAEEGLRVIPRERAPLFLRIGLQKRKEKGKRRPEAGGKRDLSHLSLTRWSSGSRRGRSNRQSRSWSGGKTAGGSRSRSRGHRRLGPCHRG